MLTNPLTIDDGPKVCVEQAVIKVVLFTLLWWLL
jgi:hypothetical protein